MRGRRGGRLRAVLLTVLGLTGLALGGGWAWVTRRDDPLHAVAVHHTKPPTLHNATTQHLCRSPLTVEHPLQLWIGGDSLAGSLGPALGRQAASTGVVAPTFDSRPSSGLARPSFFNWSAHATAEMARLHPEIVVFIIGTNDFSFTEDIRVDAQGAPAWRAYYLRLVEQMLAILGRDGRPVIWVGGPTLRDAGEDAGVRKVNDVARSVVKRTAAATYVDAYKLFSGRDGGFTATLPGVDGSSAQVRTSDGIHFTPKGAELLAEQVFALLDARCRIRDQAVLHQPQPVREAPGSSQLPPTNGGVPSRPTPAATSTTGSPAATTTTGPPPLTLPSTPLARPTP